MQLDKIKVDLMKHGVAIEEYGGTTQVAMVSAKTGEGVQDLLEMILLQVRVY